MQRWAFNRPYYLYLNYHASSLTSQFEGYFGIYPIDARGKVSNVDLVGDTHQLCPVWPYKDGRIRSSTPSAHHIHYQLRYSMLAVVLTSRLIR